MARWLALPFACVAGLRQEPLQQPLARGLDRNAPQWEQVIDEVIAEEHPYQLHEGSEHLSLLSQDQPFFFHKKPSNDVEDIKWFFGSQHKSGTDLLRGLAMEQAGAAKQEMCASMGNAGWAPKGCENSHTAKVWYMCNISWPFLSNVTDKGTKFRAVHILRDPVAMVISGYIFHKYSPDTQAQLLQERQQTEVQGLATEARFVLQTTGATMKELYHKAPKATVMPVRLESFTASSKSFDEATKRLYSFTVGDRLTTKQMKALLLKAKLHDLRRFPDLHDKDHVSNPEMKERIRHLVKLLPEDVIRKLKALRRDLGYVTPEPALDGMKGM